MELLSYKVLDSNGNGNMVCILNAINEATAHDVDIINASFGYVGSPNNAWTYAIQNFPGLVVCAACNTQTGESSDNDVNPKYPANYNYLSNVITVGASDQDDDRAYFSCYGQISVDLFAPGENILSCYPTSKCTGAMCGGDAGGHYANGYHEASGTSMAAPHVAGVAALMLSENPSLSAAQLKGMILDTVDTVYDANGNDIFPSYCVSGGRLNAQAAVTLASQAGYAALPAEQEVQESVDYSGIQEAIFLVPSNELLALKEVWTKQAG